MIKYYRDLLTEPARIEAFRRAISSVVRESDCVLDVGTALGTFAFFAADAGARHVWAVEGRPVVSAARVIARINGYGDRVQFVSGWIPEVPLPERATVVLFEDLSPRLVSTETFRLLEAIHARYAAPGARFVPRRARLHLAPVGSPEAAGMFAMLGERGDVRYGIDWSPSRECLVNTPLPAALAPDWLTAPPVSVSEVSFQVPPKAEHLGGVATWTFDTDMTLHGLAHWFDLELCDGEWLSNAPGALPGSWGQLLLPIDPPLDVPAGVELRAAVGPERFPDGAPGWLRWSATAAGAERRGHEFAAEPASLGDLYAQSPDAVPTLSDRGHLETLVLQLTDGRRTIREIGTELSRVRTDITEVDAIRLVVRVLAERTERRDRME